MKILVTGGAGFIGSHLVDRLVGNGHHVRILDNLDPQTHQSRELKTLSKEAEFIRGDVRNPQDWSKALDGMEVVYHLGAAVGISQSMHRPVHFLEVNTVGTANLYEILLNNSKLRGNIKKIIVPGSKTIYGEGTYKCRKCGIFYPGLRPKEQLENGDWEMCCPDCGERAEPIGTKEDKPVNPISIYALSKYDTENIALNFGHALNIPTLVFRGFSIYGPGQSLSNPYSGVCSIFLSRIKNKKPPVIFEDGKQLRDYIFVDDVVSFLTRILDHDVVGVYNLGTGKPTSVNDIARILLEETGSELEPKLTGEFRVGDNRHDFADMTKTEKEVGFSPKFRIKEGLRKLIEWGESEEAKDIFEESERIRKSFFR